jgi:tetratricopeptide (TPR) repeat protein
VDDLINEIKIDQKNRAKIDEPLSMNISTVGHSSHEPTNGFNSRFVHSLLFIDALIRMKSIDNDKQQLITLCNNEYENNATQLSLVREFEKEYSADKALWWYTRDSFLYRMLNKALRIQNIDLLILFHSLIVDIYHQLKENQCLSPIHVYRGHVISDDELNTLRESIGKFIFINSFLSTSTNHHAVLGFLRDCNILDGLHRVLFEIDADPGVITSRPFANISAFSDFDDEDEVLFMVGSVFRLVDINRDDDEQLWLVRIKLCGDDEYKLNEIFDDLRKEYGGDGNEINLRFFGDVLRQMGKHDQAEKTYHRLLNELPANDPSIVHLYRSFGILYRTKGEYDSSLQWFHKALTIQTQRYSSNYADIGDLYKWIGFVYSDKNNHDKALEYYSKAVEFFNQSSDQNQLDIAHIYNNMGIIYKQQEKYVEALDFYQSSLTIKQDCLPAHHSSIAMSHNNIGNVHLALGQYNLAMYHHELSLNIRLTSLPSQHPDIAMSYRNIALVYENKCEWEQALIHYEKSATIYRHLFPSQHPNISRIESDIQRVS